MATLKYLRIQNCRIYNLATIWVFATGSTLLAQEQSKQHPLVPALQMAKQSLAAISQVQDYEAKFTKREVIKNQLTNEQTLLRIRHQPFSVYMKFLSPAAGREVLYVNGKNKNQLLAREASGLNALVGTVSLPVDSPMVMANTRHPITNAGMKKLIELIIKQWEIESKYGEIDVKYYPNAKLDKVACEVIQVTHPRPRKQFNFAMTRVFFDKATRFPVRVENYAFPAQPNQKPSLVEEYTYENIRVNLGLTDADFDRRNPKYSF